MLCAKRLVSPILSFILWNATAAAEIPQLPVTDALDIEAQGDLLRADFESRIETLVSPAARAAYYASLTGPIDGYRDKWTDVRPFVARHILTTTELAVFLYEFQMALEAAYWDACIDLFERDAAAATRVFEIRGRSLLSSRVASAQAERIVETDLPDAMRELMTRRSHLLKARPGFYDEAAWEDVLGALIVDEVDQGLARIQTYVSSAFSAIPIDIQAEAKPRTPATLMLHHDRVLRSALTERAKCNASRDAMRVLAQFFEKHVTTERVATFRDALVGPIDSSKRHLAQRRGTEELSAFVMGHFEKDVYSRSEIDSLLRTIDATARNEIRRAYMDYHFLTPLQLREDISADPQWHSVEAVGSEPRDWAVWSGLDDLVSFFPALSGMQLALLVVLPYVIATPIPWDDTIWVVLETGLELAQTALEAVQTHEEAIRISAATTTFQQKFFTLIADDQAPGGLPRALASSVERTFPNLGVGPR